MRKMLAWVIKEPGGTLSVWSGRSTKHACIYDFVYDCGKDKYTWAKLFSEGYRCVRVEIRELATKRRTK